jgi:hypothetical protein
MHLRLPFVCGRPPSLTELCTASLIHIDASCFRLSRQRQSISRLRSAISSRLSASGGATPLGSGGPDRSRPHPGRPRIGNAIASLLPNSQMCRTLNSRSAGIWAARRPGITGAAPSRPPQPAWEIAGSRVCSRPAAASRPGFAAASSSNASNPWASFEACSETRPFLRSSTAPQLDANLRHAAAASQRWRGQQDALGALQELTPAGRRSSRSWPASLTTSMIRTCCCNTSVA